MAAMSERTPFPAGASCLAGLGMGYSSSFHPYFMFQDGGRSKVPMSIPLPLHLGPRSCSVPLREADLRNGWSLPSPRSTSPQVAVPPVFVSARTNSSSPRRPTQRHFLPEGPAILHPRVVPTRCVSPIRSHLNALGALDGSRISGTYSVPHPRPEGPDSARTSCSQVTLPHTCRANGLTGFPDAQASVRTLDASDYIVYSSPGNVLSANLTANPTARPSADFSPKNSVWKRLFAQPTQAPQTPQASQAQASAPQETLQNPQAQMAQVPQVPQAFEAGALESAQRDLHSQTPVRRPSTGLRRPVEAETLPATAPNSARVDADHGNVFAHEKALLTRRPGLKDVVGKFGMPATESIAEQDLENKELAVDGAAESDNSNGTRSPIVASQASSGAEAQLATYHETPAATDDEPMQQSRRDVVSLQDSDSVSRNASDTLGEFVPEVQVAAIAVAAAAVEEAASDISSKYLYELRSLRKPPAAICQAVETALRLFGVDAVWSTGRRRLDSQFLQKLRSFTPLEAARCPSAQVQQFLQNLDAPVFCDASLLAKCPAAAPLARWCVAAANLLLRLKSSCTDEPPELPDNLSSEVAAPSPRECPIAPDLGGLYVKPLLWEMSWQEQQYVQDLEIGRAGVGQVIFHGVTDCRDLLPLIPQILSVQPGEIIVYPDAALKPDVGQGLNKPASIVLHGCMPKSQSCFVDQKARQRYRQRVAQMTQDKGAIFEDYDPLDGTWKFRVPHF
ncbi:unnamed protein product [Effrenium voratum]|nr:unnamed protein product [Effrenium voratum]